MDFNYVDSCVKYQEHSNKIEMQNRISETLKYDPDKYENKDAMGRRNKEADR